ncbi:alanine racemase [Rathayibacter soli]|uniref:alanine racemase n=1 Tax=Rathayibacter soli TaxID=3144168 RepID=UPI0027E56683|nr:alanine racemase [Glaciibacter superstes]
MSARAIIDLEALRANVTLLSSSIAPAETMLAVKANAYGHGLIPIATAGIAAGASSLAVLEIPAGLELRDAGVAAPLFAWLHGTNTDFRAGIEADIQLGVSAEWQLHAIAAAHASKPAVVHLKLDSGLSRNGATPADWPALVTAALAAERAGTIRVRGAWSHLADASVEDDEAALQIFRDAVATAHALGARFEVLHLAASSAGIRMPQAHFDLVRFGIAAYGISPFDDRTAAELGLRPVMSLQADVVELIDDGPGTLARVAVGYADGLPTRAVGRAQVLLDGRRSPVVALAVDSMLVAVQDTRPRVGDTALVFGPGDADEPTAADWAHWASTIGDEIVTHLSARVPRSYRG